MMTPMPGKSYNLAGLSQSLADSFGRAAGVCEYGYRLGGLTARLRCAGNTLAEVLTPALAHLSASVSAEAEVTICAWDAAANGVSLPLLPDGLADYLARGEVRGYAEDGILVSYQFDAGALSLYDPRQRTAYYLVADAAQLPQYITAMPLRDLWHWSLQPHGRQLAHAGAVGTKQVGVLLAGRGGSGKSTTALACLLAGLRYASDDYCLLANDTQPMVYSLYQTGKLESGHAQRFPRLVQSGISASDKALFFLKEKFPAQLVAEMPLRAILLPRVTGQHETFLTPAQPGEALQALAPSTIFQLPGGGARDFRFLAQMTRQLPCYRLALGTEIELIPQVIHDLLEGLADA